MQINSTGLAGLIAFVPAAIAAAAAALVKRRRERRGEWAAIAALFALLAVEILANERFRADMAAKAWLRALGVYAERRPPQAAVLVILALAAVPLVLRLLRRAPTRRLAVARGAAAAIVLVFLVETVSLHQVDALLYRRIGPILLIGWLWLACGWTVVAAALSGRR